MAFDPTKYGATQRQNVTSDIPVQSFSPQGYGAVPTQTVSAPDIPISTENKSTSFPYQPGDNAVTIGLKVLGNMPASTWNFGKRIIQAFNPLETVKTEINLGQQLGNAREEFGSFGNVAKATAKQVPQTLFQGVIPKFIQNIVKGNYESAGENIVNDPVGEIAPILLTAKWAFDRAGMGEQFDNAIVNMAKPVTAPAEFVGSKLATGAKAIATQTFGLTTGVGAENVNEALKSTPEFRSALHGNVNPRTVVDTALDTLEALKKERGQQYEERLANLPNTGELDTANIENELSSQLRRFNITEKKGSLDFSKSPIRNDSGAVNDITTVWEDITANKDNSPLGLDTLKKNVDIVYSPTSRARAFVSAMRGSINQELKTQVPEYQQMVSGYEEYSNLISDMQSLIGKNENPNTIFSKLTTAMKSNNELRQGLVQEFQARGENNIKGTIAGLEFRPITSSYLRVGLATGEVLLNGFQAMDLLVMSTVSPRIMGEFLSLLGLSAQKASAFIQLMDNYRTIMGVSKSQLILGAPQINH